MYSIYLQIKTFISDIYKDLKCSSMFVSFKDRTQDNTLFQQSFERVIGLLATLSFQDHS